MNVGSFREMATVGSAGLYISAHRGTFGDNQSMPLCRHTHVGSFKYIHHVAKCTVPRYMLTRQNERFIQNLRANQKTLRSKFLPVIYILMRRSAYNMVLR